MKSGLKNVLYDQVFERLKMIAVRNKQQIVPDNQRHIQPVKKKTNLLVRRALMKLRYCSRRMSHIKHIDIELYGIYVHTYTVTASMYGEATITLLIVVNIVHTIAFWEHFT